MLFPKKIPLPPRHGGPITAIIGSMIIPNTLAINVIYITSEILLELIPNAKKLKERSIIVNHFLIFIHVKLVLLVFH